MRYSRDLVTSERVSLEYPMAFDIVAIGEPLYEFNQQPDGRFLPGFGGDTSNVAIAARRLGADTAYVTRLGNDMFGDALVDLWTREGVDHSGVVRDNNAPTGIYFVTHDARGHHFSYRREGSAASRMSSADIPEALIGRARYLHVSGISQAISDTAAFAIDHAIAIARTAGVAISYDTNFRSQLWSPERARKRLEWAAPEAALIKTSLEDAGPLLHLRDAEAASRHILALSARAVVVTMGKGGVHAATADRSATIKGFDVEAIDATGAGDALTGALLAELARGAEFFAACRFANAAAALSTLGYGAIAALPRRAAVEKFLGSMGASHEGNAASR
jgi:2-dehydro-3-deoxygluconokinase